MPSTLFAYRVTASLLWALAFWHSWVCRGLFVYGSAFLVQIASYRTFLDFYPPRRFAMLLAQFPVIAALKLGTTNLEWLGRLLSLGFFLLPTTFYSAALYRARRDPVLLGAVIAIIAIVFLPVSFFIVGEYNTLYAFATFIGITLLTTDRLKPGEGVLLAVLSAFSIRIYEAMVYVGPLLIAMTLWRVWRSARAGSARVLVAAFFYLLAAVLFGVGT